LGVQVVRETTPYEEGRKQQAGRSESHRITPTDASEQDPKEGQGHIILVLSGIVFEKLGSW